MIRIVLLAIVIEVFTLPTIFETPARTVTLGFRHTESASESAISSGAESAPASSCKVSGKRQIAISCDYQPAPAENVGDEPRIALLHATLSFKTNTDNWLRAEFTFTNAGATRVSENRSVYLAFDDDAGHNFIRRVLPSVDFRSLSPGERRVFSERLLIPALQPGHYVIQLWIPDSDPALKFNPDHNFLLSNLEVPDRKSGLNRLAEVEILH